MTQNQFEEVNRELDFARYNLHCLIALFGYKKNSIILLNKSRALSAADCIISTMTELKEMLESDN